MKTIHLVVVAETKEIVCQCTSLVEAVQCRKELIAIDKADGAYEKGFYSIISATN